MAITWGAQSGKMKVGIEVRLVSSITPSSTHANFEIDFWIEVINWRYQDNQRLNWGGTWTGLGAEDFYNYQASTGTVSWKQKTIPSTMPLQYGGGPNHRIDLNISGAYDGSAPAVTVYYTIPARPASVPGTPGVSISNVTASSAKVNLTAPASNGASIDSYQVQVSTTSNFSNVIATLGGTGTVTGLSAATTYYVRARAHNSVGWGAYSATKSFTTGATVPSKVGTVTVSNIGQISADLSWAAPANGGSSIEEYNIQIATNSGFTENVGNFTDEASPYAVSVDPGKTYWVRVRAVNAVGTGTYSNATSFTTLAGTPVIITPTENEARTDGIPYVIVESFGITGSSQIDVEFSQDNTFGTGVITVTSVLSGPTSNNRYNVTNTAILLVNGTWYARAKVTNNVTAYVTPWSTTRTFTQSHTPSAVPLAPVANEVLAYTATTEFRWNFVDSAGQYDSQSSYQLVIEDNATSDVVYDSGKAPLVTTTNVAASVDIAIPVERKNATLRWRVKVWDSLDQESLWSGWNLFEVADVPVVTIIEPTIGVAVDTGAPSFSWSVSILSGGTQDRATIKAYDSATNDLIWEVTVLGAVYSVTPESVVFINDTDYHFTVTVTDTTGLVGSASESFHTSYVAPLTIPYTFDVLNADNLGYAKIDWSTAQPDITFVSWKIYRKIDNETSWTLIDEIFDQNVRSYEDYMLVNNSTVSYSVTQTAMRSGVKLESSVGYYLSGTTSTPETRVFNVLLSYYWLIHPTDPSLNLRLVNVTSDSSILEFEKETYGIIGRGRHVDYGDELGYAGTITCQVRAAESQSTFRKAIETLRRRQTDYYLRTPFGRLIKVSLGNISWNPIPGTGSMEMGDLSFPYEEVA